MTIGSIQKGLSSNWAPKRALALIGFSLLGSAPGRAGGGDVPFLQHHHAEQAAISSSWI